MPTTRTGPLYRELEIGERAPRGSSPGSVTCTRCTRPPRSSSRLPCQPWPRWPLATGTGAPGRAQGVERSSSLPGRRTGGRLVLQDDHAGVDLGDHRGDARRVRTGDPSRRICGCCREANSTRPCRPVPFAAVPPARPARRSAGENSVRVASPKAGSQRCSWKPALAGPAARRRSKSSVAGRPMGRSGRRPAEAGLRRPVPMAAGDPPHGIVARDGRGQRSGIGEHQRSIGQPGPERRVMHEDHAGTPGASSEPALQPGEPPRRAGRPPRPRAPAVSSPISRSGSPRSLGMQPVRIGPDRNRRPAGR